MCSKWVQYILSCCMLTSCSYFFGDKEENNSKNYYDLSFNEKTSIDCVNKNTELLRAYFNMEREDDQMRRDVIEMKECLVDTVNLFVRHTKGGQPDGGYSAEEIHNFLNSAFTNYQYPLEFMTEAFQLKESLLGGSAKNISREDIKKLIPYLEIIYDKLALMSHQRRLLFSSLPEHKGDRAAFLRASEVLRFSIQDLLKLSRKSQGDFDFASLTRLIPFFLDDDKEQQWKDNLEIVNGLQALLASGQRDTLDIQKFPNVANNLVSLYLSYIEFEKYLKDQDFYKDLSTIMTFPGLINSVIKNPDVFLDDKVETLNHIQLTLLEPLRQSIAAAPEQKLKLRYVEELIDVLERQKRLPSYAGARNLKAMMPQLFGRWMSSKDCKNICEVDHMTVDNIDVVTKIVNEWKERQEWVNSFKREINAPTVNVDRAGFRARQSSKNMVAFQKILNDMNHMHWEEYVVIGSDQVTYKDMVIFNSIYTLVNIFSRPYNGNPAGEVWDYYLTRDQTQDLFTWFRDLGVELKIIDPRSASSGATAFVEINLFGSKSYNPEELNFIEMAEWLEISVSTGIRSISMMENEFIECRVKGLWDVFDFEKVDTECTRPLLLDNVDRLLFSALPDLQTYLGHRPPETKKDMLHYLEKAARQGMIADEPFETDTFRLVSSIAQYGESLFLRFDINRDEKIDPEELKGVMKHIVPNIRKIIKEALPVDTANNLYWLFPDFEENLVTYIIEKKEIPAILESENYAGQLIGTVPLLAFKTWVNAAPDWLTGGRANVLREDILLVVSSLAYFNRVQKIQHIKAIFWENDFRFDEGITDIDDQIFANLSKEIACSSKVSSDVKRWLFERQKDYWVKAKADEYFSIFGWKVNGSSLPFNKETANWTDAVVAQFVKLIYTDPKIGALCNLPYVEGVQVINKEQRDRKIQGYRTGYRGIQIPILVPQPY